MSTHARRRLLLEAVLGLLAAAAAAHATELRDPTRPPRPEPHAAATHERVPALTGILCRDGVRSAILDGRVVHAGSVLGAITVDSVLADGVRYRYHQKVHEVRFSHAAPSIKRPAALPRQASNGVDP